MKRLIALPALLCTALLIASSAYAEKPESRWTGSIEAFETQDAKEPFAKNGIVFVGSSSIRMWDTDRSFPEREVLNRGFGGSQTSDVLQFLDELVLKHEPNVVVFYCGDNDIAAKKTPARVKKDIHTFFNRVHEHLPETSIVYIPIKPSVSRWKMWEDMSEVNQAVEKSAKEKSWLYYCDTATPLLDNAGKPMPKLFKSDGLHLSDEGYSLWNEQVEKTLQQIDKKD